MNYMEQNGVVVIGNRVIVNGKELPPLPVKGAKHNNNKWKNIH